MANDDRAARDLLDAGTDLAGAVLGATAGAAAGDPSASIMGTALGVAIAHAVRAVGDRLLDRERARAGVALRVILDDSETRRARGENHRTDGFFDAADGLRPDAEELLEGVLRQAAESWEERKLPFLAHLWTATAYDEDIPAADARFLTRLAGDLTYRQLVALAVLVHHDDHFRRLARAASLRAEGRATPDAIVIAELDELGRLGLVGVRSNRGTVRDPAGLMGGDSVGNTEFGRLRLTDAGTQLARLLGTGTIEVAERDAWLDHLTREGAS